jgi:hypothetical protein
MDLPRCILRSQGYTSVRLLSTATLSKFEVRRTRGCRYDPRKNCVNDFWTGIRFRHFLAPLPTGVSIIGVTSQGEQGGVNTRRPQLPSSERQDRRELLRRWARLNLRALPRAGA